jgi:hypothetical protein
MMTLVPTAMHHLIAGRELRATTGVTSPLVWSVPRSDNASALRVPRRREDNAERYTQRLDLIAALMRKFVDADDDLPVAKRVTRPAFEQAGERAVSLPHLVDRI